MGPQKAVDREFVYIDFLLFFVCFGSCSLFLLLSSFFLSLSSFFFFVPPRTQREDAERHSAGLLPPSWLHLGPMLDHHSPSWLHLGPMLDHLGSPKPPQKCFGSPKAPRAKKYQKIASVWTASWLHGGRFLRSYSMICCFLRSYPSMKKCLFSPKLWATFAVIFVFCS